MWIDDHIWIRFILNLFFFHTNTCENWQKKHIKKCDDEKPKFNTVTLFIHVLILHSLNQWHKWVSSNLRTIQSHLSQKLFLHTHSMAHTHTRNIFSIFLNDMIKYDFLQEKKNNENLTWLPWLDNNVLKYLLLILLRLHISYIDMQQICFECNRARNMHTWSCTIM